MGEWSVQGVRVAGGLCWVDLGWNRVKNSLFVIVFKVCRTPAVKVGKLTAYYPFGNPIVQILQLRKLGEPALSLSDKQRHGFEIPASSISFSRLRFFDTILFPSELIRLPF
jgi:hypothetical protein